MFELLALLATLLVILTTMYGVYRSELGGVRPSHWAGLHRHAGDWLTALTRNRPQVVIAADVCQFSEAVKRTARMAGYNSGPFSFKEFVPTGDAIQTKINAFRDKYSQLGLGRALHLAKCVNPSCLHTYDSLASRDCPQCRTSPTGRVQGPSIRQLIKDGYLPELPFKAPEPSQDFIAQLRDSIKRGMKMHGSVDTMYVMPPAASKLREYLQELETSNVHPFGLVVAPKGGAIICTVDNVPIMEY